ncbi:hypothetical protein MEBOL_002816 [Melittangium boletus DSM 14713]|uniref:DUF3396 domain-containing protein n=2 Tax=Melittangium boletus TaxID=83453 RepID=A0A250IE17_9BACT|nr:hypothetical protein MEBOL_002816 [Melittangium boletus DSM 14713]
MVNERYPHIRFQMEFSGVWIHEGLRLDFYMRRLHTQMAQAVMRSLDIYVEAVKPGRLGFYLDDEGDWWELDEEAWALTRRNLLERQWPRVLLADADHNPDWFAVEYLGNRRIDDPEWRGSDQEACVLSFCLSTEYLEEQGPARVRELALRLAEPLPWCSGNVGLALLAPTHISGVTKEVYERCMRYPGLDIPSVRDYSRNIGTRIRGPSWLTFVGPQVLSELGGVEALRARLQSPGTTVEALEGGRAVVTLGEWPEAGDYEKGLLLPAYRELARVLEPWLYEGHQLQHDFPPDELRRWERRFLE